MTTSADQEFTNRLIHETSPYLLQHAHNPVDWRPWGEEAIAEARAQNKPIFLSIGYSACHWCHVMEHESFENEEIAAVMNEHFINIKVDREERPDLDDIYMQAVQMMSGHGGWPMSVFLTPDLKPFFGGTYFPPRDGPRGFGFPSLVRRLAEIYRTEPQRVAEGTRELLNAMQEQGEAAAVEGAQIDIGMLTNAVNELLRRYDATYGGFGGAPKFPPTMALNLLLREHRRTGDPQLLEMAETTLAKMAGGGIRDHLLGGFHRYSTDHRWLVPHFEKMLYDNALLAPVYFDASLVAGKRYYEEVGRGILDDILRDMTDTAGGYISTQDADSEGEEGKFYVWDQSEIMEALGAEEGKLFCGYYDVTEHGNFEGKNILNAPAPVEEFAKRQRMDEGELRRRLDASRAKLEEIRRKRIAPGKDDKILTAWNGMMISAMARGSQVTGEARYKDSAERAADFILRELVRDGRLLRVWRGGEAKIGGFIDDYALFATGLLDLYETSFNPRWIEAAADLADKMIALFYDEKSGGFYTSDGADPTLLIRRKDTYDGATPSGNSAATLLLLRLALLLDRPDYRERALKTMSSMHTYLTRLPAAVHHLLCAVALALDQPKEIAIVGELEDPKTRELLKTIWGRYFPSRALAASSPSTIAEGFNAKIPLLAGKTIPDGAAAAFVCKNYTCQRPVSTPGELDKLLS